MIEAGLQVEANFLAKIEKLSRATNNHGCGSLLAL